MLLIRTQQILPEKYQCPECDELHDDERDARNCCPLHIREVYQCPTCRELHMEHDDAIACHEYDPDGPPPPPTAAELEAMGQLRLIP